MRPFELTGMKFGRLLVTERLESKAGASMWRCKCDCGKISTARGKSLKYGNTRSCGCLVAETAKSLRTTHGARYTSEYRVWTGMKARCLKKSHFAYKFYGGKGVKVCDRWLSSFQNFYKDMGARPIEHTLDRIDNNGNYEPKNCRWATRKQQNNNRSISLGFDLYAIAQNLGITYGAAYRRIKRGKLCVQ